jgi:predicted MFS family arabinose efflux permease
MRRLLLLASAVVLVDTAFFAAITPILPRLAADLHLSKGAAGVLAGSYAAGTFVGALPGGWLAGRAGVRPTVVLGLSLMSATSVAFAFAHSIVVLDLARFVQGIGGAFSWAGALGWLVGAAPRERRAEMIGSAVGAAIVGALFGPVLGAAAAAVGTAPVFCTVAAAGLVLIAWAASTPPRAPTSPPSADQLRAALRDHRVATGMWLMLIPGMLFGALGVLGPLRMDALGAGAAAIAGTWLVAAGFEAIVAPVVGRIADRRGRRAPALAGLAAAACAMALLPWPHVAWLLAALVVFTAPAVGILWAPSIALLSDGAEAHGLDQGYAFGLVNLAWAVGQTAGAAGGAGLAQATGDKVPYLALAALCAATLTALARRGDRASAAV